MEHISTFAASARLVMERCDSLARYSEESTRLTRCFASQALKEADEAVAAWMDAAGMIVRSDSIGNLIGRYEANRADAKILLLGSHLDTVRDAGKYDGPLGVLTALACVERLYAAHRRLPFAIEVLAFTGEEGLRYQRAYLGSKAAVGTFDLANLDLSDIDGVAMADAIRAFGGDPDPIALQRADWRREELLGYCEVHIEQGPVLEANDLAVAVVSAIAGQSRITLEFTGEAGHAGTVPMQLRHDALCAAAEFVLMVETVARGVDGLMATVGQLSVQPGAANVIPGLAVLSLDVRHQDNAVREQACNRLYERAREIALRRQLVLDWQCIQVSQSILCTPHLVALWEQAVSKVGQPVYILPSGAGHDAVALSEWMDVAMLFVRCRGGISHHPAESVKAEDVEIAIQVLEQFLLLL